MAERTRVLAYEGLYRSQAEERFHADAAEAARHGWYPTAEQWMNGTLVVTYAPSKRPPRPVAAGEEARRRSRPSAVRLIAWVIVLLVLIPALTFFGVALLNLTQHGSIIAP